MYCTSISPQFPVFLPRKRAACAARSLFKRLWLLPSHRSAVRAPTEEGPSRPTSEQDLPQSAVDMSLATDRAKPFQGGHGSALRALLCSSLVERPMREQARNANDVPGNLLHEVPPLPHCCGWRAWGEFDQRLEPIEPSRGLYLKLVVRNLFRLDQRTTSSCMYDT